MELEYIRIQSGATLGKPEKIVPYKAIVIIEEVVGAAWQDYVSDWLVQTGCVYMMAWGRECSSWDDSVDYADIRRDQKSGVVSEEFVMTSWHENETLQGVIEWAKECDSFADATHEKLIFLDIGKYDRKHTLFRIYKNA